MYKYRLGFIFSPLDGYSVTISTTLYIDNLKFRLYCLSEEKNQRSEMFHRNSTLIEKLSSKSGEREIQRDKRVSPILSLLPWGQAVLDFD